MLFILLFCCFLCLQSFFSIYCAFLFVLCPNFISHFNDFFFHTFFKFFLDNVIDPELSVSEGDDWWDDILNSAWFWPIVGSCILFCACNCLCIALCIFVSHKRDQKRRKSKQSMAISKTINENENDNETDNSKSDAIIDALDLESSKRALKPIDSKNNNKNNKNGYNNNHKSAFSIRALSPKTLNKNQLIASEIIGKNDSIHPKAEHYYDCNTEEKMDRPNRVSSVKSGDSGLNSKKNLLFRRSTNGTYTTTAINSNNLNRGGLPPPVALDAAIMPDDVEEEEMNINLEGEDFDANIIDELGNNLEMLHNNENQKFIKSKSNHSLNSNQLGSQKEGMNENLTGANDALQHAAVAVAMQNSASNINNNNNNNNNNINNNDEKSRSFSNSSDFISKPIKKNTGIKGYKKRNENVRSPSNREGDRPTIDLLNNEIIAVAAPNSNENNDDKLEMSNNNNNNNKRPPPPPIPRKAPPRTANGNIIKSDASNNNIPMPPPAPATSHVAGAVSGLVNINTAGLQMSEDSANTTPARVSNYNAGSSSVTTVNTVNTAHTLNTINDNNNNSSNPSKRVSLQLGINNNRLQQTSLDTNDSLQSSNYNKDRLSWRQTPAGFMDDKFVRKQSSFNDLDSVNSGHSGQSARASNGNNNETNNNNSNNNNRNNSNNQNRFAKRNSNRNSVNITSLNNNDSAVLSVNNALRLVRPNSPHSANSGHTFVSMYDESKDIEIVSYSCFCLFV